MSFNAQLSLIRLFNIIYYVHNRSCVQLQTSSTSFYFMIRCNAALIISQWKRKIRKKLRSILTGDNEEETELFLRHSVVCWSLCSVTDQILIALSPTITITYSTNTDFVVTYWQSAITADLLVIYYQTYYSCHIQLAFE